MKVVIGLGNPGEKYGNNRHNAGYMAVAELQKLKIPDTLVRPTDVFMNESGEYVSKIEEKYHFGPTELYVIHDDLDIKLGEYKIQFGRGPKVHNGLLSIYEKLGTKDFWHIRIGVDSRDPEARILGEQYVLEDFTDEEKGTLNRVISEICKKLETL